MTPEERIGPDPTMAELESPLFEAIWQTIKTWDVNVAGAYEGYMAATGNHAAAILHSVKPVVAAQIREAVAIACREAVEEERERRFGLLEQSRAALLIVGIAKAEAYEDAAKIVAEFDVNHTERDGCPQCTVIGPLVIKLRARAQELDSRFQCKDPNQANIPQRDSGELK